MCCGRGGCVRKLLAARKRSFGGLQRAEAMPRAEMGSRPFAAARFDSEIKRGGVSESGSQVAVPRSGKSLTDQITPTWRRTPRQQRPSCCRSTRRTKTPWETPGPYHQHTDHVMIQLLRLCRRRRDRTRRHRCGGAARRRRPQKAADPRTMCRCYAHPCCSRPGAWRPFGRLLRGWEE